MPDLTPLEYTRVWTDPNAFPSLDYTKSWESQDDFPTVETDEIQVRADMQCLYDEVKDYINGPFRDYVVATGASEDARSRQEEQRVANENRRMANEAEREAACASILSAADAAARSAQLAENWAQQTAQTVQGDYATHAEVTAGTTAAKRYTDDAVAPLATSAALAAALSEAKTYADSLIGSAIGGGY